MSSIAPANLDRYEAILNKTDGRCYYCGEFLNELTYATDHFLPKSNGGKNSYKNLVPSCRICNSRKGSNSIEKFKILRSDNYVFFSEVQRKWLLDHFEIDVDSAYNITSLWFEEQGLNNE